MHVQERGVDCCPLHGQSCFLSPLQREVPGGLKARKGPEWSAFLRILISVWSIYCRTKRKGTMLVFGTVLCGRWERCRMRGIVMMGQKEESEGKGDRHQG